MFAIDPGRRPSTHVVYGPDGHSYHCNRVVQLNDDCFCVYLRCANKHMTSCHVTAKITCINGLEEWSVGLIRGHICAEVDPIVRLERLMKHEILEACREQPYENPRHLLNRIAIRYGVEVASRVRTTSLRFAMRRARLSRYPQIPHSIPELTAVLEDQRYRNITATEDYTDNIYSATVGPPGHQSIVFVSRRMVNCLRRVSITFNDATFKSAPRTPQNRQVYQIVTVVRNNAVIPIVQAVMETKTHEAYLAVLEHLKEVAPGFYPEKAVMDFEDAQYSAWVAAFPNTELIGCYVHFCRAFRRHLGALHVLALMNALPSLKRLLRSVMAIPLLPHDFMLPALGVLRRKSERWLNHPGGEDIHDTMVGVFQYVEETWLTGWRSQILSVHDCEHRTNNACESANQLLAVEMSVLHPCIWVFIEGLRRYEQAAYTDYVASRTGNPVGQRRRRTALLNDAAIRNLTEDLFARRISVFRFLRRALMRVARLIPLLMP